MVQKHTSQGFTLIELMIVVAIIGILAGVAIPAYQDYVKRGHVVEGFELASGVKTGIWDYYSVNGNFPLDNPTAGMPLATSITGNAVESVTIANNTITVAFNNKVALAPDNTLVLAGAFTSGGTLVWSCNTGTLKHSLLPPNCRN